ncbi:MAG: hypothetical protein Kow0049_16440 [Stanieria sp.]
MVDLGIKPANKRKLLKTINHDNCYIDWIEASECKILQDKLNLLKRKFKNIKITPHYYRLFLPYLVPNLFDKVIYLDCDLIINQDISKLWEIDLENNYLLAVQDMYIPYVSSYAGIKNFEDLGVSAKAKYFNTGVLVINLREWRNENVCEKVFEYTFKNASNLNNYEQEGLNAVAVEKWKEIDPRWNQQISIYSYSSYKDSPFTENTYKEIINDPYIIHLSGVVKPWTSAREQPATDLFFKYLDMTQWSGWRFSKLKLLRQKLKYLLNKFIKI